MNHEPPTQPVNPALRTDTLRSPVGLDRRPGGRQSRGDAVTTQPGLTGYVGGLTGTAVPS
jgi:hypothetical protein